jgi:hypothetical protein
MRQDIIETTQRSWEATRRDIETQLSAVYTRTTHTGSGNVGTNAGQLIPPKFDGTMSTERQTDRLVI